MANKNLYSLISNASQQAMSKGKVPIGYATSSYEDVLKALKHTKVVFNDIIQQGQNQTVVTRQSTTLTKLGIAGAADDTGFIVFDDNKISYQAVCTLKDYMSFVINYTTQGSQTKQERGFVSVFDRPAPRCHATQGMSLLQGSLPTFPPTTLENETIKRLSQGLDGQNSTCIVGVGISISDFAMKFFNRFFQEIKWSVDILDKLSSRGFLFAEVLLPTSDSEALVLHSKVTVKHQINDQSSPFEVWLPIPILLLSQFSKLGQVFVTTGNNVQGKVGENGITFPLSDSSYSHKNAAINGFTPSFLKSYVPDVQGLPKFVSTNLCNSKVQQKARVRLYLSPDCKQYLTQLINGEIPQSYQTELFRGQAQPSSYTRIETIGDIVSYGQSFMEAINACVQRLNNKLNARQVVRALDAIGKWETGGDWASWHIVGREKKGRWGTDDAGYNIGYFSVTEKHGGLYSVLVEIQKCLPPDNQFKNDLKQMIRKAEAGIDKGAALLTDADGEKYKEIYREYEDLVMAAQVRCVILNSQKNVNTVWGEKGMNVFLKHGFSSPLGLASCVGHGIWRPYKVQEHYASAASQFAKCTNQTQRVQVSAALFLREALRSSGASVPSISAILTAWRTDDKATLSTYKAGITTHKGWWNRANNLYNCAKDPEITSLNSVANY